MWFKKQQKKSGKVESLSKTGLQKNETRYGYSIIIAALAPTTSATILKISPFASAMLWLCGRPKHNKERSTQYK